MNPAQPWLAPAPNQAPWPPAGGPQGQPPAPAGQPPQWPAPQGVPQQWAQPQQPAPQPANQQWAQPPQQPPANQQWPAPPQAAPAQPQYAPPQQQYAPPQQQYGQPPQQQYAPAQQYAQPPQQNWGGGGPEEDIFAGLDHAMPEGQRGEFFEEGSFHVRIEKTTMIKSRKGKTLYTIECEVTASDSPEQPAGTRCTAMVDMSNKDMRDKNLLNFLAAVMGYDPGTFPRGALPPVGGSWSNLARLTLGNDQPLRGRELAVRVVQRETRAGGEFNDLGWLPKPMLAIGAMRAPKPAEAPTVGSQQGWGASNGSPNGAAPGWGPKPGAGPAGAWVPQAQPAPQGWNPAFAGGQQSPAQGGGGGFGGAGASGGWGAPQAQPWGPPREHDQIPF